MGETTGAAPAQGGPDTSAPDVPEAGRADVSDRAEGPAPERADVADRAGGPEAGRGDGSGRGNGPDRADGRADGPDRADGRADGPGRADGSAPHAADGTDADGTDAGAPAPSASDPRGDAETDEGEESGRSHSRRPPAVTLDTARPEGGGRAAPGDAPAPARQWPLLTVLGLTAAGLLIVGTDAFTDAVRIGIILIGVALLTGAVLRRVMPSVGMLAVRSRFTDMVTYGVLGTAIVLLALVAQPKPWLDIPIIEEAVHFTVR